MRMKKILLVTFIILAFLSLNAQENATYQTEGYQGFKAFKEFFIKDSLLFYFTNGHTSGCVVGIMKYDHKSKSVDYYRSDKKNYSLLSGAVKTEKVAADSVMFSATGFCKYEGPFSGELVVNNKSFELDSNGICKISKKMLLGDSNKGIIKIGFDYLGKYNDSILLNENENLIMIFFHLNSSGTMKDVNSVDLVAIRPGKDEREKYFDIGRNRELFKRVDFSESGFSQVLFKFLNICNGYNLY